ncbi:VOC family protein [Nocardia sp. XZ_19_385]|uniref:VOC family protein n=1 Tax=Nocardia sp. XZ_19_385 TaxID=2769488 RepID=UPI00188ED52A|nr:VOC family protein [Nocardia sp. XZ_19_385]
MIVMRSTLSLMVDDPPASSRFFTTYLEYHESAVTGDHVRLTRSDAAVEIVLRTRTHADVAGRLRDERPGEFVVSFTVPDVAAEYDRLRRAGAPMAVALREEPWGDRLFQLIDPNGIVVELVQWIPPAGA